jgi:hypothetical protein
MSIENKPFEYTGTASPIMPSEAATLAKNFNCPDPAQKTFVGLPPSIKNEYGLPSGLEVTLTFEHDGHVHTLTAFIAGGRGGMLRLSTDVMDTLKLKPNAPITIRLTGTENDRRVLSLAPKD